MRTRVSFLLFSSLLIWGAPASVMRAHLPIRFEAGVDNVRYTAHAGRFDLSILDDGNLWKGSKSTLRTRFLGASRASHPQAIEEIQARTNYFVGSAASGWRTNVVNYARVRYNALYPGVDAVFYGNEGYLEYDFVVASGADPSRIRLRTEGAKQLRVDSSGDLILKTGDGEMRWKKPVAYQQDGITRVSVD